MILFSNRSMFLPRIDSNSNRGTSPSPLTHDCRSARTGNTGGRAKNRGFSVSHGGYHASYTHTHTWLCSELHTYARGEGAIHSNGRGVYRDWRRDRSFGSGRTPAARLDLCPIHYVATHSDAASRRKRTRSVAGKRARACERASVQHAFPSIPAVCICYPSVV